MSAPYGSLVAPLLMHIHTPAHTHTHTHTHTHCLCAFAQNVFRGHVGRKRMRWIRALFTGARSVLFEKAAAVARGLVLSASC